MTTDTRATSDTMVERLGASRCRPRGRRRWYGTTRATSGVRRGRRGAKRLGIALLFPPSYSPNLNRIERLWTFTKTRALRGNHSADFATFRAAIDDCLDRTRTDHREALASLLTPKFQTFDNRGAAQ